VRIISGSPTLSQVHVEGAGSDAFVVANIATPKMVGVTAVDNAFNRVLLSAGTVADERSWEFGGLPVHLTSSVTVNAGGTLTIAPGTVVKVPSAAYFSVSGTVIADGTAEEPIIFTSEADDTAGGDSNGDRDLAAPAPGDWEAFYVGSPNNLLDHVQIRYAGDTNGASAGGLHPALDVGGRRTIPS
jgi:hypothetical protein